MMLGKLWKSFFDLLPDEPRLIGDITANLGAGRYRVELISGGVIQVTANADYAINDKVFIVGKVIESKAPNLTALVIEV